MSRKRRARRSTAKAEREGAKQAERGEAETADEGEGEDNAESEADALYFVERKFLKRTATYFCWLDGLSNFHFFFGHLLKEFRRSDRRPILC